LALARWFDMVTYMKTLILSALLFCAATVAKADDLSDMLADAAPNGSAAAVLYLWQDGQGQSTARGQLRPGGRAAKFSDRFAIASVGKTMTSVALLQLVQAGKIGLDAAAAEYLPADIARQFNGLNGISVRHLLDMRSGLVDYYGDDYFEAVLRTRANQNIRFALGFAAPERPKFRPGKRFDYSNTNYLLVQLIIEQVSGQNLAGYFQQNIFKRAGMGKSLVFGTGVLPSDFVVGVENIRERGPEDVTFYYQGQGYGDGAVISTAADLARFYEALFVKQSLLSPALLKEMLKDPVGARYGLGIEVEQIRSIGTVLGHSGADVGFTADVRFCPKGKAIAVALFASDGGDTEVTYDMLKQACS